MEETCELTGTDTPRDRPKSIEIREVANGFTVTLQGGKATEGKPMPYRHDLLIANNIEEAIKLAQDHLEK